MESNGLAERFRKITLYSWKSLVTEAWTISTFSLRRRSRIKPRSYVNRCWLNGLHIAANLGNLQLFRAIHTKMPFPLRKRSGATTTSFRRLSQKRFGIFGDHTIGQTPLPPRYRLDSATYFCIDLLTA